jgi:DnaD/phage-associated family protein
MSEQQDEYKTEIEDALEMPGKGYEPAAVIEQPTKKLVLRESLGEEWTVAWVKLSTAFKPHIKNLKGSPLAIWLYISLSINKDGVSFPGIRTIAEATGYSHQGVLDAIQILEEKGYLHVRRGERRFNIYQPEFAAIGRTNEPSETVKSVESTQLTEIPDESTFSADESTFSSNESSGVDLNKKNKKEQENTVGEIFKSYEKNIGPIVQIVSVRLLEAIDQYPKEWITDAIGLSVVNNKRNWGYCDAILKRWQANGKDSDKKTVYVPKRQEGVSSGYFG